MRVRNLGNKEGGAGSGAPGALATTIGEYYLPFGASVPVQWYAWLATRHKELYGTPDEAMGTVAVTSRKHAQLNDTISMVSFRRLRPMRRLSILRPIWGLKTCATPLRFIWAAPVQSPHCKAQP